jgi:hypothetical protein
MKFRRRYPPRTLLGTAALVIATACTLSLMVSLAKAGPKAAGVKAPHPVAVTTGTSGFNRVTNEVRLAKLPSVNKETCRGRGCPHRWPPHQH